MVFGAEGLETEALQRIAREFNLSETTFVLPPADPASTARVRIFSTKREMPFAGHPNIGTATVLAWRGEVFGRPIGEGVLFEELAADRSRFCVTSWRLYALLTGNAVGETLHCGCW